MGSPDRGQRGGTGRFIAGHGLLAISLIVAALQKASAETSGFDPTTELRIEFMPAGDLRLDGRELPLDSLQQALAARPTVSPPERCLLALPSALESWRVGAVLETLRRVEHPEAPELSCAFLPVALFPADAPRDTVFVCVPQLNSTLMTCDSLRVRRLRIPAAGRAELDGVPIELDDVAERIAAALGPDQDAVFEAAAAREVPVAELLRVLVACGRAGAGSLCLGSRGEELTAQCFRGRYADCGAHTPALLIDHPPVPEFWQAPRYPAVAKEAGVTGVVMVSAWIDEQGRVVAARGLGPSPAAALTEAALAAALQWRFKPAQREGLAVTSTLMIPFEFRLAADRK